MSDRTESACAYIFILLLQVSAFKPKTVLVWMTHFMITLPLALNQMRLREAMRDIQDHPADGWTNPYVNNGPAHSKCHSLSIITSEINPFVRMNKSVSRKVLCKQ